MSSLSAALEKLAAAPAPAPVTREVSAPKEKAEDSRDKATERRKFCECGLSEMLSSFLKLKVRLNKWWEKMASREVMVRSWILEMLTQGEGRGSERGGRC